jgi:hypothetical protein
MIRKTVCVLTMLLIVGDVAGGQRPGPDQSKGVLPTSTTHVDSIAVILEGYRSVFGRPLRQIIRDSASFAKLWRQESNKPLPHIDFRHEDVIVAAFGGTPNSGYQIHVREVRSSNTEVTVFVDLTKPDAHCVVTLETQSPVTIVRHWRPRHGAANLPVQFTDKVSRSCGP